MSYKDPITSNNQLCFVSEKIENQVKQALSEGKHVEYENSSFDDPSVDWSRILIDGKPIPFMKGY